MWFSGILNRNYGCYSDQIYVTASETIERHSVYEASAEIDKNVNTFSVKMKGECRHQKLRMIINLDCGMLERQAGTVGQTHFNPSIFFLP